MRNNNAWRVYNGDDRFLQEFTTKEEAEAYAEKLNHKMQTCGFYVREQEGESHDN